MTSSRPPLHPVDIPARPNAVRRHSSVDLDTLSELDATDGADDGDFGAVPASFATQMAMAMTPMAMGKNASGDSARMNKLVLAKMKTLEEGMSEMVREMRVLRQTAVPPTSTGHNSGEEPGRIMGSGSSGGVAVVEVAGREERKTRMGKRRWVGRGSAGAATPQPRDKGKGNAVAVSDTDEEGAGKLSGLDGFGKKGSSF
jgi:hypothetical protein